MTWVKTWLLYVDDALDGMIEIVTGLGGELANRRPDLTGANSPYAILTHCLGVLEYWGGQVVAGRDIERDRDAEFRATGEVTNVAARTRRAGEQLRVDLAQIDPDAPPRRPADETPDRMTDTQGGVLLHIYEELAQHRGQMEITRDLLRQSA